MSRTARNPIRPPLSLFHRAIVILIVIAPSAPRAAALAAEAPARFAELEKQMFGLVNADRAAHQKKPYEYDEALAAVARAHSRDMLENHFFEHKSPTTGMVADRLAAAKFRVMACGENISMSVGIEQSEAGLMHSPGHRANLLSEVYTHVGIGIVQAPNGMYYITQAFAAPAPKVDLAALPAAMLAKLNEARIQAGKLPFQGSAVLDRLAAEQAKAFADAGKVVAADLGGRVKAAGIRYKSLNLAHVPTWNPEDVVRADALAQPKVGLIGFGLAENTKHRDLGLGIIWTVVIFTEN